MSLKLKHVVIFLKIKEIFVYLILKHVFRVEKKALYHLHCSTCNLSGMEDDVHFVFPKRNRKQCNISLILKSCNPSGTQSDTIFLVLKCV